MKINNTVIFLSFILVAMICIGSAAAVEDNETVDSLNLDDESEDSLLTSPNDELSLSASQTMMNSHCQHLKQSMWIMLGKTITK